MEIEEGAGKKTRNTKLTKQITSHAFQENRMGEFITHGCREAEAGSDSFLPTEPRL